MGKKSRIMCQRAEKVSLDSPDYFEIEPSFHIFVTKMKDTNFLFGEIGTCSVDSERQHIIYKSNA